MIYHVSKANIPGQPLAVRRLWRSDDPVTLAQPATPLTTLMAA
jgi:hypothetical protein